MIVSGSNDKTVRIWDAIGHPVGDPLSLVEACNGLAFRAKRIILATGNATHRDPITSAVGISLGRGVDARTTS